MYRTELATICRLHKEVKSMAKKKRTQEKKKKSYEEMTRAEINELARERGLTYGYYVALKYLKKI